jgi:hypothetical protein
MVNTDDDVGFIETATQEEKERKIKLVATIKTWVAIALAILSLGFSVGLWAAQSTSVNRDISVIQDKLNRMPPPEKVANKEVVDIQFKNVMDSLSRIDNNICKVSDQISRHAELDVRK